MQRALRALTCTEQHGTPAEGVWLSRLIGTAVTGYNLCQPIEGRGPASRAWLFRSSQVCLVKVPAF